MGRREIVKNVAASILRRIGQGKWPADSRLPPVRELAVGCGVSPRTMMAALKRLAARGLLRLRQRKRTRTRPGAVKAARALLRRPPASAPAPRMAILFPESLMPPPRIAFYGSLIRAIEGEARRRGTAAAVVAWSVQNQFEVVESLVGRGFDRALVLGFLPLYAAALFRMRERGLPFMVFNNQIAGLPLPSVVFDQHTASREMAERFIARGHRDLCLVVHPQNYQAEVSTDLPYNRGKASGWLECLEAHGVLASCTMPLYLPWQPVLGIYNRQFREVLRRPNRPTAILFAHGPWAKMFLKDAEFSRFRVPRDLSLATFETTADFPEVPWCPPMTYIDINYARTAQCILETLGRIAEGDTRAPTIHVALDTVLTVSIGPAPGRKALRSS